MRDLIVWCAVSGMGGSIVFDKLEDLVRRFEEVLNELGEPDVANNQERFRKLMKEQNDLAPIVETYRKYKAAGQTVEDSLSLLDEENDEEMREMLKEELSNARAEIVSLEREPPAEKSWSAGASIPWCGPTPRPSGTHPGPTGAGR